MDFVSKRQTYEAIRKLLIETAADTRDVRLEQLARDMQMEGDHSKSPELYKNFLGTLRSDPISPQNALDSAAQFLQENVRDGRPDMDQLIKRAKETAQDPETGDHALWNRWIKLLDSV